MSGVVISSITGLVVGDDWRIRRVVPMVGDLEGLAVERACLIIKRDLFAADSEALVVREITSRYVSGQGRIEVRERGEDEDDGEVRLRFEVGHHVTSDARLFEAGRARGYSVRVLDSAGWVTTVEKGMMVVW